MPVVINRCGHDLRIPEIQRVIPYDGLQYVVPVPVLQRYRRMFELVPVELQRVVEEQRVVIDALKKKSVLLDAIRVCDLKESDEKFDVLYPFHFAKNVESAVERLLVSIESLINQNVRICVCNNSPKCIKKYLPSGLDYIHVPGTDEKYCKPKTINIGVKKMIRSEYFFTSDIDLVYPPTFVEYMRLFTLVKNPIRVVFMNYNLGETTKMPQSYEECQKVFESCQDNLRAPKYYALGNGLVHFPSFKKVGGYDERFVGHGSEDSEFNYRMFKLNKYFQIDWDEVNTYHLWHSYTTNINSQMKINEQQWRYIVWKGETENIPLIKAGQIEFPDDLMEVDWSLSRPVEDIMLERNQIINT